MKDKLKDLRHGKDIEFGDIIEVTGDNSLGFFTTDKGYRIILSSHSMYLITKHYKETDPLSKTKPEVKEE